MLAPSLDEDSCAHMGHERREEKRREEKRREK
jgi:hypothetical protein